MGIDGFLKRYFGAVLCLLIAIAAYFQASGMGQLVVASVALDPSAMPFAAPASRVTPRAAPKDASEHTSNASAILTRNPFDSVTGPLDGKSIDLPTSAPSATIDQNADPYKDNNCDFAKVVLIASSDDPSWSFAILAGSDGKTQMRREGDDFAGHKIDFVGDRRDDDQKAVDKRDIWDRVWLTTNGLRCQVRVGGPVPTKGAAPAPSGSAAAGEPKHGSKLPSEIANKIHKTGDTTYDIERSVVDAILENQALLMRSARVVPEKEGDKVVGIRLFGIRSDSLLGTLGVENGDRLSSVNGYDMSDPQKALEAYTRLRTADHLTMSLNRHGSPMNLDYNIK